MCGIAGILDLKGKDLPSPTDALLMSRRLIHRGPDDDGYLADGPVALAFRRLSIIDLTTGHQPVHNEDKSIWCMANGEVYNYRELRDSLEARGHSFYTNGDTEAIVHSYEEWGLEFVSRLRGMFAIAIWDGRRHRLVLARDRIGKKPIYYGTVNGQLAFASELKALLEWPRINRTLDISAVRDYLRFLYVPAPRSILRGVRKLLPGHLLVADTIRGDIAVQRYWSFEIAPELDRSEEATVAGLREHLEEAVRLRLRSDVPLGAFLSGGLDSSAVVSIMAQQSTDNRPLSFSMGFQDKEFDETRYARLVARDTGTDHHEEIAEPITPETLLKIVWHMDEPFGDSSCVPTYQLCQWARRHVKVALSGDGGDELFAGYDRYRQLRWIIWLDRLPIGQRKLIRRVLETVRKRTFTSLPSVSERLRRIDKALEISTRPAVERFYALEEYFDPTRLDDLLKPDGQTTEDDSHLETILTSFAKEGDNGDPLNMFLYLDTVISLPDDMLTKVDRMSMAHGLEVRSPILDQEVVEYASGIPSSLKLRKGVGKYVFKQAIKNSLSPEIIQRRKHGFELPLGQWLSTSFRELVEDCLSNESIQRRGLLHAKEVTPLRNAVLKPDAWRNVEGLSKHQVWHRTWAILMLELWCREFLPDTAASNAQNLD